MSWNIPEKQKPEKIVSQNWGRIGIVFICTLVTIVVLCSFIYYITHDRKYFLYFFISLLSSVIAFLFISGCKLFRTSIKLEKNEMMMRENSNIDAAWSEWASDYISIIGYNFIFPEKAQVINLKEGKEINVIGQQSLIFPSEVDYNTVFHELLAPLRHLLMKISDEQQMDVAFLVCESSGIPVWQSFVLAWKKLGLPEHIVEKPGCVIHNYVSNIDDWIDEKDDKFRLVVVCEEISSYRKNNIINRSDGACVFLCAPLLTGSNIDAKEKARIYRAVETNVNNLAIDLNNILMYQSISGKINNLFIGNHKNNEVVSEIAKLCIDDSKSKTLEQYFSELFIGSQGEYDTWMAMIILLSSVVDGDIASLIVSESDSKILLSKVKVMKNQE